MCAATAASNSTSAAIAATRGLIKSRGAIDYLICVADADRASTCCDIENPPLPPVSTTEWLHRANASWTAKLRSATSRESARVFGRFLRWSQESLLIAGHDVDGVLARLGCRNAEALRRYLTTCRPSPVGISDDAFVEHYRHPGRCLDEMLVAGGARGSKKGDIDRDDALDELSRKALQRLCARVPDLLSLASFLRDL